MEMKVVKRFILLFAVAMFVTTTSAYARDQRMISVVGDATVSVEPDRANIFLGVDTQYDTPAQAQTRNSEIMTNVIDAIISLGIDESDIQTSRINMHPVHDWDWSGFDAQPRVIGYMVSNHINITVRDISMVSTVLSAATDAGANSTSNVVFGILDTTAAYNQALALAIADAKVKANVIAQALGVNLGEVYHVSEHGQSFGFGHFGRSADIWLDAPLASAAGASIPVQIGELDVSTRVNVTFSIN